MLERFYVDGSTLRNVSPESRVYCAVEEENDVLEFESFQDFFNYAIRSMDFDTRHMVNNYEVHDLLNSPDPYNESAWYWVYINDLEYYFDTVSTRLVPKFTKEEAYEDLEFYKASKFLEIEYVDAFDSETNEEGFLILYMGEEDVSDFSYEMSSLKTYKDGFYERLYDDINFKLQGLLPNMEGEFISMYMNDYLQFEREDYEKADELSFLDMFAWEEVYEMLVDRIRNSKEVFADYKIIYKNKLEPVEKESVIKDYAVSIAEFVKSY